MDLDASFEPTTGRGNSETGFIPHRRFERGHSGRFLDGLAAIARIASDRFFGRRRTGATLAPARGVRGQRGFQLGSVLASPNAFAAEGMISKRPRRLTSRTRFNSDRTKESAPRGWLPVRFLWRP